MSNIEKTPPDNSKPNPQFKAWSLAGELGYMIAIPIVLLALLGRLADKYWNTSPWMLLTGILLSIFISTFMVYKKTVDILR
ncbi:MAG: hypothetical protein A3H57_04950 [Candidatus Taylorbacteria bacterium RIFCSPLOWO2_02_FULL_43_11]|uniref:AtpZ/AtpI family protein n=1 Tax=Candidatus Taylorbacteria bacterium RIFCSPHIGHO2_02_FULL_43_32b TaxID=1802306 RepID=A0A1G2MJW1_9BACT|nr:MAG: hypothetical protein A2743_03410 [Candidatus Taylorbacteria bacterium RIFCSPHIGHO2_01_FULL_43_47]OHA24163.1 MAG: hypothetical protein A3C72_03820 [Candidatus Taylorbacteria bacterium RIFCSPHIGHO2_02_FULL_43_32b]OHA31076.1 MAG: hypothetical protein A3B08_01375 [Candidatus Taylorbacteria bacterium RIFCSPLOWO2_01_FULL_43_44]OHA37226.1 MAG: hypothetical protein A3H57_04950 [Candidatus Taylorbacteria bacterium RIFCSPLOWO2_02_FULL_43_11]